MIKSLQKQFGGLAQAVYNIVTNNIFNVGFKSYGDMLFRSTSKISPFDSNQWSLIMKWYKVFAIISSSIIFIAVVIISYKIIASSISVSKRNEAKENLLRLFAGGIFIAVAPTCIKILLFMNNTLVNCLVAVVNRSGAMDLMDNDFLSSITTGNPIATALVISMFIYIFVKLNIKFIARQFSLIVFTIFTPIAAGLWIINKNTTAAVIWSGQIMINVFMQFIYCFLFLVFASFMPIFTGWAIKLVWAMMLLPLADVLMNCLQNLTSRIAGLDSNEISMRGLGLGAALAGGIGYTASAIKTQFTSSKNSTNTNNGNSTGFVSKLKNFVNPQMNLSEETDYNGNVNPIRNVVNNKPVLNTSKINNEIKSSIENNTNNNLNDNHSKHKVLRGAYNVSRGLLRVGANMAEGDFEKRNNYKGQDKKQNNSTIIANQDLRDKLAMKGESDDNGQEG